MKNLKELKKSLNERLNKAKYIKREGSPGKYKYVYKQAKGRQQQVVSGAKEKTTHIPDDENPRYAFGTSSNEGLAKLLSLTKKYKGSDLASDELKGRLLNDEGEWEKGISDKKYKVAQIDSLMDAEENPLRMLHSNILSQIAKGKIKLEDLIRNQMMNRSLDSSGKWVGPDASKKHHSTFMSGKKPITSLVNKTGKMMFTPRNK